MSESKNLFFAHYQDLNKMFLFEKVQKSKSLVRVRYLRSYADNERGCAKLRDERGLDQAGLLHDILLLLFVLVSSHFSLIHV